MAKKQNHATTILIALVVIITVCLVRHFHIKNFRTVLPGVLYNAALPLHPLFRLSQAVMMLLSEVVPKVTMAEPL